MLNQKNQKEKNAIESLLSMYDEPINEMDYDIEMKKLLKPHQHQQIQLKSQQTINPRSQLLKLISPIPDSKSRMKIKPRSLHKPSEKQIVPDSSRPIYLSLKSQRQQRNMSEYKTKTINLNTIQVAYSLSTINPVENQVLKKVRRSKNFEVKLPWIILKSKQRL